jgi:hypothetical protein
LDLEDDALDLQPAGNLERKADRRASSNDNLDAGLQAGLDGVVVDLGRWALSSVGPAVHIPGAVVLLLDEGSACYGLAAPPYQNGSAKALTAAAWASPPWAVQDRGEH